MAEIMRMPAVLAGASEASIQTWFVEPGTVVAVGQPLAEIETDKATVELAAESAGTIGRLLASEGANIAVGDPILALVADGEGDSEIDAALSAAGLTASSETSGEPAAAAVETTATTEVAAEAHEATAAHAAEQSGNNERQFVSPIVRRMAREHGVELTAIRGTGPNGRIVRRDLEAHLSAGDSTAATKAAEPVASVEPATSAGAQQPSTAPFEDIPLDRMRKAIARRLTESKSTVPHFYLVADCNVGDLLELRAEINKSAERKISVNDFVLKAAAQALTRVPAANAIWNVDSIRRFSSVDIAVAVATEGGLMTPVVRGVEKMPLSEISRTVAELAERARDSKLKQHELEGGSFAVSNLGMYGTSQFSAILNPPQSGILAVGAARKAPVVGSDGQLTVGSIMTVTLSADHRVLDGAVAAEWLAAFQNQLENPLTILI